MGTNNKLKAFVRFDGSGRIIPSSLILQRNKPKVGNWQETPAYECCNSVPVLALRLLFSNITEVSAIIGDASNVGDWNTYFDLPTYGNPFTSVSVIGNQVELIGGSNIIVKEMLFDQPDELGTYLLEVDDTAGCIIEVEYDGFGYDNNSGCKNVSYMNLPALITTGDFAFNSLGYDIPILNINIPQLTTAGKYCFQNCPSLTTINLPQLINAGEACLMQCLGLTTINLPQLQTAGAFCFYLSTSLISISLPLCTDLGGSVGNNSVFLGITGNTITATFNSVLATCDAGNPDGDIVYLDSNNTVTINYV